MAANAVVRARIDEKTKKKAALVLKSIGLTPSAAFRLLMTRIANEKALPFALHIPNAKTAEALKAVQQGELTTAGSVEELFRKMNATD